MRNLNKKVQEPEDITRTPNCDKVFPHMLPCTVKSGSVQSSLPSPPHKPLYGAELEVFDGIYCLRWPLQLNSQGWKTRGEF